MLTSFMTESYVVESVDRELIWFDLKIKKIHIKMDG